MNTDPLIRARAAVARLYHHGRVPEPAEEAEVRREYATEKIAHCITQTMGQSPALTDAQLQRLIALLQQGRWGV